MNRHAKVVCFFAAIGAGLFAGCASSTPAEATGDSMTTANKRLDAGIAQVDAVVGALNSVVAAKNVDLKPPFKKFTEELEKTQTAATNARQAADEMRAKANEQFEKWAKEAQNIGDAELKQANIARRDEARAAFAKAQDARDRVKIAYEPFLTGLKDIHTFLKTDLTARGVDAISSKVSQVQNDGEKLKAAIRDTQKAISDFRAHVASQGTSAK